MRRWAILLLAVPLMGQTIDGDTVRVNGVNVRLFGIDAPEFEQTCGLDQWPAGRFAFVALNGLIAKQPVTCHQEGHAVSYGRPVSKCYANGFDLGEAMVMNGWAWNENRFTTKYQKAEAFARSLNLGVHAHQCDMPWEWRKARKERR